MLDLIGTMLWIGMLVGLGYALGHHAVVAAQTVSRYGLWFSIAIVTLIIVSQVRSARAARVDAARSPAACGLRPRPEPLQRLLTSAGDDRGRERDPVVLRPRRPHSGPRGMEDLVGPVAQHPDRLIYHCRGVIEVNFPAASVRELGEGMAIHYGVGAGLKRRTALDGDVLGELWRPRSQ